MKILQRSDLDKVRPKFRNTVLKAWENNEEVPYVVTLLSSEEPTDADIAHAKELCAKYKWE